jgi:membrane associated rhomboid family serine protease
MQKLLQDGYGNIKWLYVLFVINVVGFILAFFTTIILNDTGSLLLSIHNYDKLSLVKIWKLITYSIADVYVPSLISNLLWLWIFGSVLAMLRTEKFVFDLYIFTTIIIGIIGGILCFFIQDKFVIQLVGFTPALVAIATACIYLAPTYKFPLMLIGEIPIWILGVAFLLLRIFFSPTTDMLLIMLLYLLAIPIGILFVNFYKNYKRFQIFRKKPKGKLVAIKTQFVKTENNASELELNAILEKISASGINSLSNAEKTFLENYHKKNK